MKTLIKISVLILFASLAFAHWPWEETCKTKTIFTPDGSDMGYASITCKEKQYDFCFKCLENAELLFKKDEIVTVNGVKFYCSYGKKNDPLIKTRTK